MMKRVFSGILLGLLIAVLLIGPVMAAVYYAYLAVEETDGNSYSDLAVNCSRNITQLVDYGLMTSTGLDSRVLTGSSVELPHMLANDRIMFVTDLAANEERTLIFYLGATSLSSFPIIVGYNGSFTTPDDPDLELGYVMELLIDGYFNAGAAYVGSNILYKEDAIRVWIAATNTLKIAVYNSTGDEQWSMNYTSFTTGDHVVYILCNGAAAYLYVDDFVTAKDTENLFESSHVLLSGTAPYSAIKPKRRNTFYHNGLFWAFYQKSSTDDIYYKTSADGTSWSSEYTINGASNGDHNLGFGVCLRDGYMHLAYGADRQYMGGEDYIRYRMGIPHSNSTVTWNASWQNISATQLGHNGFSVGSIPIGVDTDGYPFITTQIQVIPQYFVRVITSSTKDGTWTMAGGYPLTLDSTASSIYIDEATSIAHYYNSTKMYALWGKGVDATPYEYYLRGRYYNGSSWSGTSDTLDYNASYRIDFYNAVSDADDNLYVVWRRTTQEILLRIRYSNDTWSSTVEVGNGTHPTISYNDNNGYIYMTYLRDGAVRCRTLAADEISAETTIFTPAATGRLTAAAYGDHIGIIHTRTGNTEHGYIMFPWDWNDNANNWTWMQNNSMPYADEFQLAVDGTLQVKYEPATIIEGTTLPDEESDHDATITWGGNPSGVTASLGVFAPEDEEESLYPTVPLPGSTAPQDMVGPTGQPGWTAEMEALTAHPVYPLVSGISYFAGLLGMTLPVPLIWIIGATLILFFIIVLVLRGTQRGEGEGYSKPMHQILAALAGGGWAAYCYSLGIYPFWVPVIFAVLAIAIIVGERSPTVS